MHTHILLIRKKYAHTEWLKFQTKLASTHFRSPVTLTLKLYRNRIPNHEHEIVLPTLQSKTFYTYAVISSFFPQYVRARRKLDRTFSRLLCMTQCNYTAYHWSIKADDIKAVRWLRSTTWSNFLTNKTPVSVSMYVYKN